MSEFQPYDYVPISSPIQKKSIKSNQNEKRWSGSIKVKMTVVTPLIEVKETDRFVQGKRGHTIPGSSIRGALRSAAEILWNGTVAVFDSKNSQFLKEEWKMSNCTIDSHCPVSHVFGFVASEKNNRKTEEFEKRIPWSLGSKLKFSKATAIEETFNGAFIQMNQLYSPKKKKKPPLVYSDGRKCFLGRKVYLAGRLKGVSNQMKIKDSFEKVPTFNERDFFNPNARLRNNKSTEYAIFPGTQYTFFIEFFQLTEEELADVIRLLELKAGYYHAIGKGKPLGLGRVCFEIEGIMRKDKSYYLQLETSDSYDVLWKEELLRETTNRYEVNFGKYYEFLDVQKFDNKKSYGSSKRKVYRYSELERGQKHKNG